jgi:uncharacterized protein
MCWGNFGWLSKKKLTASIELINLGWVKIQYQPMTPVEMVISRAFLYRQAQRLPFMTTCTSNSCGAKKPMEHIQIKKLVEVIARTLADDPRQVQVNEIVGQQFSVLQIRAARSDVGKIIGKRGQNADAMRTIVNAAATKLKKKAILEILE